VPTNSPVPVSLASKSRLASAMPKSAILTWPRWLIISADHAHVGSALVIAPNGTRIAATNLAASAILRHRSIRFLEASLQMGDLHYAGIGTLGAEDPLRIDADGRIDWTPAGQPMWSMLSTAHGDLKSLNVTGHFLAPFSASVSGRALGLTGPWHLEGDATIPSFDLGAWGVHSALGIITGQLALHADSSGFTARGSVVPTGLHIGPFDGEFDGSFAKHVLTVKHVDLTHRSSGAQASGSGTIGIVHGGPRLDLRGSWQNFRWPMVGKRRRNWPRRAQPRHQQQAVRPDPKLAVTNSNGKADRVTIEPRRLAINHHEVVADSLHFCKVHTRIPTVGSPNRFPYSLPRLWHGPAIINRRLQTRQTQSSTTDSFANQPTWHEYCSTSLQARKHQQF